jgi:hypothetical protein
MQKILEEIKSVQGITGVLIWDKKSLRSFQLLPASFATSVIKSTCSKMIKLAQGMKSQAEVKLFYDNGTVIILSRPSALILILGRADLNFSLLNLVLSSTLLRLEKILTSEEMGKSDFPPLEQKKVNYLIEGMNLLSHFVSDKIGPYKTTQNLRQAKEKLISAYPLMANLFVDNNANISVLKGKGGLWSGEVVLAFAKWAAHLEKLSFKKERVLDLKKITSPLEESLEEMGFYFVFQNIRENI